MFTMEGEVGLMASLYLVEIPSISPSDAQADRGRRPSEFKAIFFLQVLS